MAAKSEQGAEQELYRLFWLQWGFYYENLNPKFWDPSHIMEVGNCWFSHLIIIFDLRKQSISEKCSKRLSFSCYVISRKHASFPTNSVTVVDLLKVAKEAIRLSYGDYCHIAYPTETERKINSFEISFIRDIYFSCQVFSEIWTDCAGFQNGFINDQ